VPLLARRPAAHRSWKIQRWEIVKWTAGVNLALATAASATRASRPIMFLFCIIVAVASNILLYHYNRRMTGARTSSRTIESKLSKEITDVEKLTGEKPYPPGDLKDYDKEELFLFVEIFWCSIVPSFFVWMVSYV
jgi:hypothetical protein